MHVSRLVHRRNVVTGVAATDRDDAIRAAVEALAQSGAVPEKGVRAIVKGLLEREALGSTGIGRGIAIPHVKTKVVEEPIVAFVKLAHAVDFGATDGAHVHSLFLVVSPFRAAEEHVTILSWISRVARSNYYARILANTSDADSLHELFREVDEQP